MLVSRRPASWSDRLDELLRQEVFHQPAGNGPQDRHHLTYRRLSAVHAALGLDRTLATDPDRLHALFARTAVVDPSLFHLLASHLVAGIGIISEYGDGSAGGLLEHLESSAAVAAVLITEAGHGASHIAQRTRAAFDPVTREFVLHTPDDNARKQPSTTGLAGVPKVGLVSARLFVDGLDRGVFTFALHLSDKDGPRPGVEITPLPQAPLIPADYAAVRFHHVRIPFSGWLADGATIDDAGAFDDPLSSRDARLARTLAFVADMQLGTCVAASAVARASITSALNDSYRRITMARLRPGVPVIRYRTQQRALFGALATTYALCCLTRHVRSAHTATKSASSPMSWSPWAATDQATALAKARITEAADHVIGTCRLHTGARGFLTEPFPAYQGLVQGYQLAAGSNQLIKLDAARAMTEGTQYQPPESGLPEPEAREPLDQELWRHLLRRREHHLHRRLLDELTKAAATEHDEFSVWNDQLLLAETLTESHLDRVLLETALADSRSAPAALRPGIDLLCAILASELISPHRAWYLTSGLLTPAQAAAWDSLPLTLYDRVEPHARTLANTSLGLIGDAEGWA
ncbi:hypothetical protein GCM10010341_89090 [Streptomyces noursei]|nr:hypothetical protein GCM10010341_89090 [Streptomyces noursei]